MDGAENTLESWGWGSTAISHDKGVCTSPPTEADRPGPVTLSVYLDREEKGPGPVSSLASFCSGCM